ncbi:hypothetical protein DFJ58DRAFT_836216 [Suillus subalutaceus]|uniref:uncharacterized protein n=1 Tax=Suillus subalutaceus TaxID=48586 RepID=UPI001B86803C|nr:uncharacterized protein DFJ58DRAFT_836216 [Suillus subalutaceus]KAG1875627.1 hypothetical protein DFJ58DRAFT_836216 [Suillus subalutaceus]
MDWESDIQSCEGEGNDCSDEGGEEEDEDTDDQECKSEDGERLGDLDNVEIGLHGEGDDQDQSEFEDNEDDYQSYYLYYHDVTVTCESFPTHRLLNRFNLKASESFKFKFKFAAAAVRSSIDHAIMIIAIKPTHEPDCSSGRLSLNGVQLRRACQDMWQEAAITGRYSSNIEVCEMSKQPELSWSVQVQVALVFQVRVRLSIY